MRHIAILLGGPGGPRRMAMKEPIGREYIEVEITGEQWISMKPLQLVPVKQVVYTLYPMPSWSDTRVWLAIYRGKR